MVLDTDNDLRNRQVMVTRRKKEQRPAGRPRRESWEAGLNGKGCRGGRGETGQPPLVQDGFLRLEVQTPPCQRQICTSLVFKKKYLCVPFLASGGRREAGEKICLSGGLRAGSIWLMSKQLFGLRRWLILGYLRSTTIFQACKNIKGKKASLRSQSRCFRVYERSVLNGRLFLWVHQLICDNTCVLRNTTFIFSEQRIYRNLILCQALFCAKKKSKTQVPAFKE